jgi:nitroreductase
VPSSSVLHSFVSSSRPGRSARRSGFGSKEGQWPATTESHGNLGCDPCRRNVRAYQDKPIPQADLDRIAEAGWRAPSASNRQHWDFIIVTDRSQLAATDLGIGSGHSSVGDQDKARAILGVPGDHLVAYLIGLGYPADRPLAPIAKPDRRPLSEVIHHGRW